MSGARPAGRAVHPLCRGPVAALLLAAAMVGCGPDLDHAPAELLGRWITDAPRYADRAFVVSRDSIIFHTGGDSFTAHALRGVDIEETAEGRRYTVHYHGDPGSEPLTFSFYYNAGSASIRPVHQPEVVWTQAPS